MPSDAAADVRQVAFYGGTSFARPSWAGFIAIINEASGNNLGTLNPPIYPLTGTGAFHSQRRLVLRATLPMLASAHRTSMRSYSR